MLCFNRLDQTEVHFQNLNDGLQQHRHNAKADVKWTKQLEDKNVGTGFDSFFRLHVLLLSFGVRGPHCQASDFLASDLRILSQKPKSRNRFLPLQRVKWCFSFEVIWGNMWLRPSVVFVCCHHSFVPSVRKLAWALAVKEVDRNELFRSLGNELAERKEADMTLCKTMAHLTRRILVTFSDPLSRVSPFQSARHFATFKNKKEKVDSKYKRFQFTPSCFHLALNIGAVQCRCCDDCLLVPTSWPGLENQCDWLSLVVKTLIKTVA